MTDPSNAAMTSTPEQMTEYERCADCDGSGLSLNSAGEPDDCRACKGNTVVASPVSQPEQKPVAVKALEWSRTCRDRASHYADNGLFGSYSVWEISGDAYFCRAEWGAGRKSGHNLDAAKAAAQADYEIRIRSALVDAPAVAVKDDMASSPLASVTEQAVEAAALRHLIKRAEVFIDRLEQPTHTTGTNSEDGLQHYDELSVATAKLLRDLLPHFSSPQSQPHPVAGEAWQPIETAPKDKTELLVAIVGHPPIRAKQTAGGTWLAFPYGPTPPLVGGMLPTHWQPLPAPPVPEQGGQR